MKNTDVKKRDADSSCLYFQLSNEERESAVYFLLEAILKARDSDPELARRNFFDEDVNVYLAHLLFATSLPEYRDMADPFLSNEPAEVLGWAKEADDPMLRYFIYKVNADNMLIRSAVFSEKLPEVKRAIFRRQENGVNRLAVVYYGQAARCHQGIYQKRTGVGEVLTKISGHFELYQKLVFRVKEDYFKFIDCFREQAFQRFFSQLSYFEKRFRKDNLLDQFLDLYKKWLDTRDPALKGKVLELAQDVASVNPQFRFDPEKLS
jgi:hypothetical protein